MLCRSDQEQGRQNQQGVRRLGEGGQGGKVQEGLGCDLEPGAAAVLIGYAVHRYSTLQRGSAVSGDSSNQNCFVTNSSGFNPLGYVQDNQVSFSC